MLFAIKKLMRIIKKLKAAQTPTSPSIAFSVFCSIIGTRMVFPSYHHPLLLVCNTASPAFKYLTIYIRKWIYA